MTKLFTLFIFLFSHVILGQISPPGMGAGNLSNWLAVGVRQELDTAKKWQSVTYLGVGRKSNPDNYNPFYKKAFFIFNQEFYHQFHRNWQYSFALSYRIQESYDIHYPYEHLNPPHKQEIRAYGRLSYLVKTNRIKFSPTIRQEFRRFFNPDFSTTHERFQARTRLNLQLTLNLDESKRHRISLGSEQLFAITKHDDQQSWTDFSYHDSRFTLYYSMSPKNSAITLSIGYMNNLIGHSKVSSVHCFAFDLIFENPLSKKNKADKRL